jgi:hypothetical protein
VDGVLKSMVVLCISNNLLVSGRYALNTVAAVLWHLRNDGVLFYFMARWRQLCGVLMKMELVLEGGAMRRLTVRQRNMAGRLAIALMSGFGLLLAVFTVLRQDDAVSSEASTAVTTPLIGISTNATASPRNNVAHTPWEITP